MSSDDRAPAFTKRLIPRLSKMIVARLEDAACLTVTGAREEGELDVAAVLVAYQNWKDRKAWELQRGTAHDDVVRGSSRRNDPPRDPDLPPEESSYVESCRALAQQIWSAIESSHHLRATANETANAQAVVFALLGGNPPRA